METYIQACRSLGTCLMVSYGGRSKIGSQSKERPHYTKQTPANGWIIIIHESSKYRKEYWKWVKRDLAGMFTGRTLKIQVHSQFCWTLRIEQAYICQLQSFLPWEMAHDALSDYISLFETSKLMNFTRKINSPSSIYPSRSIPTAWYLSYLQHLHVKLVRCEWPDHEDTPYKDIIEFMQSTAPKSTHRFIEPLEEDESFPFSGVEMELHGHVCKPAPGYMMDAVASLATAYMKQKKPPKAGVVISWQLAFFV